MHDTCYAPSQCNNHCRNYTLFWKAGKMIRNADGFVGIWNMRSWPFILQRVWKIKQMTLTGNTKALVTDGSSTTVTTQFLFCNCGISLLLLSRLLATLATRLYAGWFGGRKWSLNNSLCWNRANQIVQQTEEISAWGKCKRFTSSNLPVSMVMAGSQITE
jgi:hypothetical protein